MVYSAKIAPWCNSCTIFRILHKLHFLVNSFSHADNAFALANATSKEKLGQLKGVICALYTSYTPCVWKRASEAPAHTRIVGVLDVSDKL